MKALKVFTVRAIIPEKLKDLQFIANNLRWAWHEPTRKLFKSIDPVAWEKSGKDPEKLFGEVDASRLQELANDDDFINELRHEKEDLDNYLNENRWFQDNILNNTSNLLESDFSVAYFSPEFGISQTMPQYSGGLGILAGDHLKAASDLGVPIVGVGLFYSNGYFNQSLTSNGWQYETYPLQDPDNMPLELLRNKDGSVHYVNVEMPDGKTLYAHVLIAKVGRTTLLLLDTDTHFNDDELKMVADKLYGGDSRHRLVQELLLGVGGVRALKAWSELTGVQEPQIYHMNEGHAGFMCIERISKYVQSGVSKEAATELVRSSTIFTTHTPVPAGIDKFSLDITRKYLQPIIEKAGFDIEQLLHLGDAEIPVGGIKTTTQKQFNMAVLGLKSAGFANGVSLLHGEVSRKMFNSLWENVDSQNVPITSVTNGVHSPTWKNPRIKLLKNSTIGEFGKDSDWLDKNIVSDQEIWNIRQEMKEEFVQKLRQTVRDSWIERGAHLTELDWVKDIFDPNILTIGFARRMASYKRLTLMIKQPKLLKEFLLDQEKPIQIVVAGKAHPKDEIGKSILQQFALFADDPEIRHRIAFLPGYDIELAQSILSGCDVWLNNPIRPLEASGTSGMKAAFNGALNLSILDGWWDECYDGYNGWEIPSADDLADENLRDKLENKALFDIVGNRIRKIYYSNREKDTQIPTAWVEMIRHQFATLLPRIDATRMVKDYTNNLYVKSGKLTKQLNENNAAQELADYKEKISSNWNNIKINSVTSYGADGIVTVNSKLKVVALVSLGNLSENDVKVQIAYGKPSENEQIENAKFADLNYEKDENGQKMFSNEFLLESIGGFAYSVRLVPNHKLLVNSEDLGLVKLFN